MKVKDTQERENECTSIPNSKYLITKCYFHFVAYTSINIGYKKRANRPVIMTETGKYEMLVGGTGCTRH